LLIHAFLGVVAFPIAYSVVFPYLPGASFVKGMVFAFVLFLLAESVVMPMAGKGFWSSNIGGIKAVVAAFIGHMVYGGLLGAIAGGVAARRQEREDSPRPRKIA
jgi:uncharacterized membrane protein YagU involved in acid resistance